MSSVKIVITAAIGFFLAGTATSQMAAPTGSIMPRPSEAQIDFGVDHQTAVARMLVSLGACLADRKPVLIDEYLQTVPNSERERQVADYIDGSECLVNANMRIPRDLLRGAIFYGAYRSLYRKSAPASLSESVIDYDMGYPNGNPQAPMLRFTDCVYRIDAGGARSLLFSLVGSTAEKAAMAKLSPDFARCIDPARQMRFNQTTLRAALAEAAYRISKASVVNTMPVRKSS